MFKNLLFVIHAYYWCITGLVADQVSGRLRLN